jgi:hypothetical protein
MGDDYNNGLSGSGAWKTLRNANLNMDAGDTVYVGSGSYYLEATDIERGIQPVNNGISGSRIEYIADRFGIYTGDSGEISIKNVSFNKNYITVDGFSMSNTYSLFDIDVCGTYVIIRNCDTQYGTRFGATSGCDQIQIYNNIFGKAKIATLPTVSFYMLNNETAYFYYNTVCGTNEDPLSNAQCLRVYSPNHALFDVYIKNNIFVEVVGSAALYLIIYYPQYVSDWNNKFHIDYNFYQYTDGQFINVDVWLEAGDCEFDNLTVFQAGSGSLNGKEANGKEGDPKFFDVSNSDYHLLGSSPCISTATDVGIYTDHDGNTRPL